MSKKTIYVAGPFSATCVPDIDLNIYQALNAGSALLELGWAVIIPHSMYVALGDHVPRPEGYGVSPLHGYETIMGTCLELVTRCDAIYLCEGWQESKGSLAEKARAESLGIPVFEGDFPHPDEVQRSQGISNLSAMQDEVGKWADHNFAPGPLDPYMGIVEEVGELSHALLKRKQGIRGMGEEEAQEAVEDALADMIIFALDFSYRNNIDLDDAVARTWAKVRQRDWVKYPETGRPPAPGKKKPQILFASTIKMKNAELDDLFGVVKGE